MLNEVFSKRISELVNESGKSMTVIASELGVSKQTISAWCNGSRRPKAIALAIIADYFQTTILWLQGLSDVKHPVDYHDINKKSKELVSLRVGRDMDTGAKYSVRIELIFVEGKPKLYVNGETGDFSEMYSHLNDEDKKAVLYKMMASIDPMHN